MTRMIRIGVGVYLRVCVYIYTYPKEYCVKHSVLEHCGLGTLLLVSGFRVEGWVFRVWSSTGFRFMVVGDLADAEHQEIA